MLISLQVPITDFFGSVRNVHLTTNPLNLTLGDRQLKATDEEEKGETQEDAVFAYGHPLPILEAVTAP